MDLSPGGRLASVFPVLQGDGTLAIAHRGGAWEEPENTRRAFQHSIDLGYSLLETDVRATKDDVAVVFHDAHLDRTTDAQGRIRELTWAEVSEARIHGREPILRLEELLRLFPDVGFNIDVKEECAIVPFLNIVRQERAWERICVGSFSHERLTRVRRMAGRRLATSLSPREVMSLFASSRGVPNRWRPPHAACVQIPVGFGGVRLAQPRFIDAAHALGWQVHVWTIDSAETMDELVALGVDGIMTDRPSLLRDVLRTRGLWRTARA